MAKIHFPINIAGSLLLPGKTPGMQAQEIADEVFKHLPINTKIDTIVASNTPGFATSFTIIYDAPFFQLDQDLNVTFIRDVIHNGTDTHEWTMITKLEFTPSPYTQLSVGTITLPSAMPLLPNLQKMVPNSTITPSQDNCTHEKWVNNRCTECGKYWI